MVGAGGCVWGGVVGETQAVKVSNIAASRIIIRVILISPVVFTSQNYIIRERQ